MRTAVEVMVSTCDLTMGGVVAQVPAWTTVLRGGAEAAAGRTAPFDARSAALFLCYPPPKSPMALQCLRSFAGDVVAYVGNPATTTTALIPPLRMRTVMRERSRGSGEHVIS